MSDSQEILHVLALLGAVYPGFELKELTVEVYLRLLSDIPADLLEQAALDHVSRSTFFPTIAELRSAAFGLLEAAHPALDAHSAWLEVQAEIERVGRKGEPHFSTPLIEQAVEALGWRNLCLSDNPVAERAHFVQTYQAVIEQGRQSARRLPEVRKYIALQAGANLACLPD